MHRSGFRSMDRPLCPPSISTEHIRSSSSPMTGMARFSSFGMFMGMSAVRETLGHGSDHLGGV